MKKEFVIEEKIDQKFRLEKEKYSKPFLGALDYLVGELEKNLVNENRYKGVVKSYMDSIKTVYSTMYSEGYTEEDSKNESKILYLIKSDLHRELSKLNKRGLSKGDCLIVILNKLLEILDKFDESEQYHKGIQKVIGRLFDNIKTRSKNDSLFRFSNTIWEMMEKGYVGKYQSESFIAFPDKKEYRFQF